MAIKLPLWLYWGLVGSRELFYFLRRKGIGLAPKQSERKKIYRAKEKELKAHKRRKKEKKALKTQ